MSGSMTAKKAIEKVREVKEKKKEQLKAKDKRAEDREQRKTAFFVCKDMCKCKESTCRSSGFKMCSICQDVQKSACTKKACIAAEQKRVLIQVVFGQQKCQRKKKVLSPDDSNEDDEGEENHYEEEESEEEDFREEELEDEELEDEELEERELEAEESSDEEEQNDEEVEVALKAGKKLDFVSIKEDMWVIIE